MPWSVEGAKAPTRALNFGVLWDDGIVKPAPPITVRLQPKIMDDDVADAQKRALKDVVKAMERKGHRMVNLPLEQVQSIHRQALSCTMMSNVQDGGRTVMEHINASGEPVVPRTAVGSEKSCLTSREIFKNHLLRGRLVSEYDILWKNYRLDGLLCPAVCHPAPPHRRYISNSYATVFNMLDYVAGCIPVSKVDEELDVALPEWYDRKPYPRIEPDRFPYDEGDKEMIELCECSLEMEAEKGSNLFDR